MAIVLHGVTRFEFPPMHDVRERFQAGGEHQMSMVRYHDVTEKKESQGAADIIENVEKKVHFGRAEEGNVA